MKIIEATQDEKKFYKSGITDSKRTASWAFDYAEHEVELGRAKEYGNNALKYFKALREEWFRGANDAWNSFEKELK